LPRALAKRYSLDWARHSIGVVHMLSVALRPVLGPLLLATNKIVGRAGDGNAWHSAFWTPDEMVKVAGSAQAQALGKPGEDLISSILEFSDTVIKEIMVPRTEMVTVPVNITREELHHTILDAGHSRIPVYDDTVDNVL